MVAREVIKDQSQLSDSEIYTSEAYSEVLTYSLIFNSRTCLVFLKLSLNFSNLEPF